MSKLNGERVEPLYYACMTQGSPHPLIAVVEDDSAVRSSLQFSLEAEGYDVCVFENALQALASPAFERADCMVIDYGLPGMDGLELMRILRQRRIDCPAIIITGQPTVRCRLEADAAGAPLLEKPLIGLALSREIRAALDHAPPH